jgi:hypothetical protein
MAVHGVDNDSNLNKRSRMSSSGGRGHSSESTLPWEPWLIESSGSRRKVLEVVWGVWGMNFGGEEHGPFIPLVMGID